MGSGSFDMGAYASVSSSMKSRGFTAKETFTAKGMKDYLNPKGVGMRESRDSVDNPNSTALIVALDVTGSMGEVANKIAVEGLGTLFGEILSRKPISDPHMMFMAVGDVKCDDAPLQVSQFEADNRILEQLRDIYVEGGGGGNDNESYTFPWYFAAMHTSIDCFEKRNKKGYLFTLGDENCPQKLLSSEIEEFLGENPERDFTASELLAMVEKQYHVFHIVIEEGSNARRDLKGVLKSWRDVLGQRVISLSDHTKLAEVIVSTIQVIEGEDKAKVAKSWDGSTSVVVSNAIKDLATVGDSKGVVRF
jgi:hypothetical protein